MTPYGSDEIRVEGTRIQLISQIPKGWVARVPKRETHAEHPGTAVRWDDTFFEVVRITTSASGIIYLLEPWRDEHLMRVVDTYDAANEAKRVAEHHAAKRRETSRVRTNILAALYGHLPAIVQTHLASELGVVPWKLTLISGILPILVFVLTLRVIVNALVDLDPVPVTVWFVLIVLYLAFESAVRICVAWQLARPMGSLAGVTAYIFYYWFARDQSRLVSPFAKESGSGFYTIPPPPDVELQDMIRMRKPFLTLLTPAEQKLLARRYGYTYRDEATAVAFILLVMSIAGILTSWFRLSDGFSLSALLSLASAGWLAVEQIRRLMILPHGPAGSVLAPLVRPLARRFLQ